MHIIVVGLSHKTAPVEVREKLAVPESRLDEALAILKKHGERTEMRYEAPVLSPNMPPIPLSTAPLEIPTRCGGVVLFVLDVAQSARY